MTTNRPALQTRPAEGEFAPYAVTYLDAASAALDALPQGTTHDPIMAVLDTQIAQLTALLANVPDATAAQSYAPGKWTLLESLVHVADTERVFAYRLLRVARGDQTPLPGFDQDAWVPLSGASTRSLASVLAELAAVRQATSALVASLNDASALRTGIASGNAVSARALVWMIIGHFAHHLALTRTRYLHRG